MTGKLEGECREDHLEVAAVLEVSRAEEAGPELSVGECCLGERLSDGGLPGPGEAVQPENVLVLVTCEPISNIFEDTLSRPLEAPLPVSAAVSGVRGVVHPVEKVEVR